MCDSNLKESDHIDTENRANEEETNDPGKSALNIEDYVEFDANLNQLSAVIKPTKQTTWVKCDLCNVPLSSRNTVQRHITGKRHLANIKKLSEKHLLNNQKIYCEMCKVKPNSMKQLDVHLKSKNHIRKLELIERRKKLKNNCLFGILIASFIFAIVINIFYAMFIYVQPL